MNRLQDTRERMSGATGLVLVGGADDNLRLSTRKLTQLHITQQAADRTIADAISDFLEDFRSFDYLTATSLPSPRHPLPVRRSYAEEKQVRLLICGLTYNAESFCLSEHFVIGGHVCKSEINSRSQPDQSLSSPPRSGVDLEPPLEQLDCL